MVERNLGALVGVELEQDISEIGEELTRHQITLVPPRETGLPMSACLAQEW